MSKTELYYAKIRTCSYVFCRQNFHKTHSFLTMKPSLMGMIYNHKFFYCRGLCDPSFRRKVGMSKFWKNAGLSV